MHQTKSHTINEAYRRGESEEWNDFLDHIDEHPLNEIKINKKASLESQIQSLKKVSKAVLDDAFEQVWGDLDEDEDEEEAFDSEEEDDEDEDQDEDEEEDE